MRNAKNKWGIQRRGKMGRSFFPGSARTKEKRSSVVKRKNACETKTIPENRSGLLRVMHLWSRRSRLDFLELWKRAQTGRLGFTGAAAGSGQKGENGSDDGG